MNKTKSFRTKLWIYFILFAAIILSLLWILQTVFLQSFYNNMLEENARGIAGKISMLEENDAFEETIDKYAFENSLLIYITTPEGEIVYSSDSFKASVGKAYDHQKNGKQSGKAEERGKKNAYRDLPDDYEEFASKLKESENGKIEYVTNKQYVCGYVVDMTDGEAYLYVSVALGTVETTASIVRLQLLWVTLLSLVIAFVIAFYIAKRFSKPIDQLSDQARSLGEDKYENHFKKGFCKELDDLNASMDEAAVKLKEAGEYQKELLSNVSHDLRTPLTLIKGYAEMVRDISWEDEEQREKDLGIIINESNRLEALVNEILEYSHLSSTDVRKEMEDVDIGAVASRVSGRFEAIFGKEGGTIEKNIAEGCIVKGIEAQLERAVYNLIDNAVKHCGEDKKIRVSVYKADGVVFEVSDGGEGIDEEEIPHIWKKYYTSRQQGQDRKKISGLGLAIVSRIAEIHGARCGVVSQKGKGSTFSISFDKK
ncbi:MAG: HAMP domain-containing histidine kinase [Clostridia bacterium]|nr:HAMP domain-containing histidine kinase [Clostridia bacterium]